MLYSNNVHVHVVAYPSILLGQFILYSIKEIEVILFISLKAVQSCPKYRGPITLQES